VEVGREARGNPDPDACVTVVERAREVVGVVARARDAEVVGGGMKIAISGM
jgi:hypothetical protein